MRFPFRQIHGLEDVQRNFEFLEASGISWGQGAPAGAPQGGGTGFYFRQDTPGTVGQRLYVWTGAAWTGVV